MPRLRVDRRIRRESELVTGNAYLFGNSDVCIYFGKTEDNRHVFYKVTPVHVLSDRAGFIYIMHGELMTDCLRTLCKSLLKGKMYAPAFLFFEGLPDIYGYICTAGSEDDVRSFLQSNGYVPEMRYTSGTNSVWVSNLFSHVNSFKDKNSRDLVVGDIFFHKSGNVPYVFLGNYRGSPNIFAFCKIQDEQAFRYNPVMYIHKCLQKGKGLHNGGYWVESYDKVTGLQNFSKGSNLSNLRISDNHLDKILGGYSLNV